MALRQAAQQGDMNPAGNADDVMAEDQSAVGDESALPGALFPGAQDQAPLQQQAPPTSWAARGGIYRVLNPQDNSYQLTQGEQYFWHPADPGTLIERGTFRTFHTSGEIGFYKNANFIRKDHDPEYGSEFWLKPKRLEQGRPVYDVSEYTEGGRRADQPQWYIYVPWGHIVEHLYGYTEMSDKESHSFFPPGTTEAQLLQYLVDALNSGTGKVPVDGVDAGIQWAEFGRSIKTFFRWLQDDHPDKYTIAETTFVKDNFA